MRRRVAWRPRCCAATTPMEPEVVEIMLKYMTEEFGNAGSRTHEYGLRAKKAVELGATMLEVGIAYGDPSADGPAIQKANLRAMAAKANTEVAVLSDT